MYICYVLCCVACLLAPNWCSCIISFAASYLPQEPVAKEIRRLHAVETAFARVCACWAVCVSVPGPGLGSAFMLVFKPCVCVGVYVRIFECV